MKKIKKILRFAGIFAMIFAIVFSPFPNFVAPHLLGTIVQKIQVKEARAATFGPISAGTGASAEDTGIGCTDAAVPAGGDWSFPTRVTTQDDSVAAITGNSTDSGDETYKLTSSQFGFSGLPTSAIIKGITVEVDNSVTAGSAVDFIVQLTKDAGVTVVGNNKADTGTTWGTDDDTYSTYGGTSDLWGTGWSRADIISSDFGVVICASATAANSRPAVDHVRITVTYGVLKANVVIRGGVKIRGRVKFR